MSAVLDIPLQRHRFSRAQYEQMVEAGVFGPDERLELLDGEIIDMAPQKAGMRQPSRYWKKPFDPRLARVSMSALSFPSTSTNVPSPSPT